MNIVITNKESNSEEEAKSLSDESDESSNKRRKREEETFEVDKRGTLRLFRNANRRKLNKFNI